MKTVTKTFNVYKFDELNTENQSKVINDTVNCFVEMSEAIHIPEIDKAIEHANNMQTPWFAGSYVWEECRQLIMEEINRFEYLENGEIFDTIKENNSIEIPDKQDNTDYVFLTEE